mgnify:CR=1 FL=1
MQFSDEAEQNSKDKERTGKTARDEERRLDTTIDTLFRLTVETRSTIIFLTHGSPPDARLGDEPRVRQRPGQVEGAAGESDLKRIRIDS